MTDPKPPVDIAGNDAPRIAGRRALMLGAVSATAVVSIRPALAQTAASVSHCEIPIPRVGIARDGTVVPVGTKGSVTGGMIIKAEQARAALNGGIMPGMGYDQSMAYTAYIRRLQSGQSGFTCFASLQMPRG